MKTRAEALARMLALVGRMDIQYILGGTTEHEKDCFQAAVCDAYDIPRHRPGFNHGAWATVSDDLNCNSAIEDSEHARELFEPVDEFHLEPGDLIMYPTIRLAQVARPFIGHVQMVTKVPAGWTRAIGFSALDVAHCHGPNGRRPAVTSGKGDACDRHDELWAKWPTRMIRVRGS